MQTFPGIFRFAATAGMSILRNDRALNCLWELTYRCTAKCDFCDYWRHPSDPQRELKTSDIESGLERIYGDGCRIVNFTGGEPMIRDDLEDIIHRASNLGMWTSVVTNGSLMSRARMRTLKKAGLDNLFVSIDSPVATEHDEHRGISYLHDRVINCMQWLDEDFLTGHRTGGLMCVLSATNIHQAEDIVKLGRRLGVMVVFQPYHPNKTGDTTLDPAIGNEIVDDLLRLKKQYKNILSSDDYLRGFSEYDTSQTRQHCRAGHKYFSVDPYGFLHPCVDMPVAGHVLCDDLSVVHTNEALSNVRSCQGCWYCFRGEVDSTLSCRGALRKTRLGLGVLLRNHTRRRNRLSPYLHHSQYY